MVTKSVTPPPPPMSASELLEAAQALYQQIDLMVSDWRDKTDLARQEVLDALESSAQLVDFLYIIKRRADDEG